MTDYLYRIDPATGDARRFYRDGAAFVAMGQPHPLAFWTNHPHVAKIADSATNKGEMTVRVWTDLIGPSDPDTPDRPRPDRPADFLFYGGGKMRDGFWEAHPGIEYFEVFNHLGHDSEDQDGWNVHVWLREG